MAHAQVRIQFDYVEELWNAELNQISSIHHNRTEFAAKGTQKELSRVVSFQIQIPFP
jgi:hypothetical protein